MPLLKKIAKYLVRLLLLVVVLLVLIAALIQIPAVQQFLTGKLENYLENTLQTEVNIGAIRLRLPESLVLQGVYVEDLQQDTLLNIGELAVNFQLNQLLRKRIQFDWITLTNGTTRLYMGLDSSNFDFIPRAFNAAPATADTLKSQAPGWTFTFDDAGLTLSNVDVKWKDDASAISLATVVGKLEGQVEQIDYLGNNYKINQLFLGNTAIELELGNTEISDQDSSVAIDVFVAANQLELENVALQLKMPDRELALSIARLENRESTFSMEDGKIKTNIPFIQLTNGSFSYDIPSAPLTNGFDYQHFKLTDVRFEIADLEYDDLAIKAEIRELSGKEAKGFELKKLKTILDFSKEKLLLEQLVLQSAKSYANSKRTLVEFPFFGSKPLVDKQLKIDTDLEMGSDDLSEIRYFYPEIKQIPGYKQFAGKPVKIDTRLKGSMKELNIGSFDFKGLQTLIKASGTLQNLDQPDKISLNIVFNRFQTNGKYLQTWLPENTLPEYVELPDSIAWSGKLKGAVRDFNFDLEAYTNRKNAPFPTWLKVRGEVKGIDKPDNAYLSVRLDTFATFKADLLAYLPPGTIPDYIQLPDKFVLAGSVEGKLADLKSQLQLYIYTDDRSNQVKASGEISGLFTSETPSFDITLEAGKLSPEELKAFIPAGLFPAYLRLPFINKLSGAFKGDASSFKTQLRVASNSGDYTVNASRQKEQYSLDLKVETLTPESFFSPQYLDSLTGFSFTPWTLEVQIQGKGLELSPDATADFRVNIQTAADSSLNGLLIEGKLNNQILTASIRAEEKEIRLESTVTIDYNGGVPRWTLDMLLKELDLQQLNRSTIPFRLSGKIAADGAGFTFDTLSGQLLITDLEILYGTKSELLDEMKIAVDLNKGQNAVTVLSDFFDAELKGEFQYPRVMHALEQQVYSFLDVDHTDSLIGKTNDHFDLEINLLRPEFLVLALFPDLKDLSSFRLTGAYDNRKGEMKIESNLKELDYQNFQFKQFDLTAQGDNKDFKYQLQLDQAKVAETVDIPQLNSFGTIKNRFLENTTRLFDEKKNKRFEVNSSVSFLEDQAFRLSFAPEQIMNYEVWNVEKNNAIDYTKEGLSVENWRFYKGEESIAIKELNDDHLKVEFKGFDLDLVSDLINSNSNYLGGILNGSFSVRQPLGDPLFASDIEVDSLMVMNARLGQLKMIADNETKNAIHAVIALQGNGNDLRIEGNYQLGDATSPLDLQLGISSLNLATVEPLTFGELDKMEGVLKGDLQVRGTIEKPLLKGQVHFENTAFDVNFAKTRLRLGEQPLVFEGNRIEFKELKLFDANGNEGVLSSYVLTENYQDFILNANVRIKNFLILNTTEKDNPDYFGKLVVDGSVNLSGSLAEPIIDITAQPRKESNLTYVYRVVTNQVESHEGIVEFLIPDDVINLKLPPKKLISFGEEFNMKVTIRMSVDSKLNFKVITNPLTGDYFEGKVKGDLVFVQYPDGNMELNGTLETVEGKYLFTYQDVVRRTFEVEPGGTISWTGDPLTPKLDISVAYKVRTSVYPLIAGQDATSQGVNTSLKQTFEVKLNIGGTPEETEIKTSVEYPGVEGNTRNSEVQAAVDRINQDPSLQNTQAFSLILFNGFLRQDVGNTDFSKGISLTGDLDNLITQQLNDLANRYISFVELDFGVDTYDLTDNSSQTNFRVSIRKRFLNDRLTISVDGKTSTERGVDENTSQAYLNNISVEYSLTPDGQFKIKIYNKQEFDDFIGGTGVKIGGAFIFSKDFNGIRLFGAKD